MNCSSKNIIHFYNFNLLISINFVECFISVTPNFFMLVFDWQLLTFPPTPLFIEIREEIKLILKRGGSIVVKQITKKCLLNFQSQTFCKLSLNFCIGFQIHQHVLPRLACLPHPPLLEREMRPCCTKV